MSLVAVTNPASRRDHRLGQRVAGDSLRTWGNGFRPSLPQHAQHSAKDRYASAVKRKKCGGVAQGTDDNFYDQRHVRRRSAKEGAVDGDHCAYHDQTSTSGWPERKQILLCWEFY